MTQSKLGDHPLRPCTNKHWNILIKCYTYYVILCYTEFLIIIIFIFFLNNSLDVKTENWKFPVTKTHTENKVVNRTRHCGSRFCVSGTRASLLVAGCRWFRRISQSHFPQIERSFSSRSVYTQYFLYNINYRFFEKEKFVTVSPRSKIRKPVAWIFQNVCSVQQMFNSERSFLWFREQLNYIRFQPLRYSVRRALGSYYSHVLLWPDTVSKHRLILVAVLDTNFTLTLASPFVKHLYGRTSQAVLVWHNHYLMIEINVFLDR